MHNRGALRSSPLPAPPHAEQRPPSALGAPQEGQGLASPQCTAHRVRRDPNVGATRASLTRHPAELARPCALCYAAQVLAKRIIPCLDVKDGRVVKGVQFVGLRDAGDPVEQAIRYDAEGADNLTTFLDITASHEERAILLDVVRRTAEAVFVPLTVGGGVRKEEDIHALLHAGADKVAINTAAISEPDLVRRASARWGAQAIVVAIDARRRRREDGSGLAEGWTV